MRLSFDHPFQLLHRLHMLELLQVPQKRGHPNRHGNEVAQEEIHLHRRKGTVTKALAT